MADLYKIYRAFQEAGYLEVPEYYDRTRKNVCRICGWENRDRHDRTCFNCYHQHIDYGKQGKKIRGLSVASMSTEDYIIFRAIAEHKTEGIDIDVTIDEYANEVKARNEACIKKHQEEARIQKQYEAVLFD